MDSKQFAALIIKYLAAGALYGLYAGMVYVGKPDAGLTTLIISGLAAIGVHTISAPKA